MKSYSLNDFVGYEYIKEDIKDLISVLKNPYEYIQRGAEIPSGMILSGAPGTGKTLLAKIIADEAKLPLYSISMEGDDDSSSRILKQINKIFKKAIKNAPSIIVLDELENMISSMNFESDTSRGVLSALLTNLDGFEKNRRNVFVIATVNEYFLVPDALRRSGRLEKHIHIGEPDQMAREEILKYYISKTSLEVNNEMVARIARKISGFTPADIKRLINTVYIQKMNSKKDEEDSCQSFTVKMDNFIMPIMQIKMDDTPKKLSETDKKIAVYHELGHQIIDWVLRQKANDIIIGEFNEAAGANFEITEEEELPHMSRNNFDTEACVLLGGRAAEDVFTGDITTGASQDLSNLRQTFGYCYMNGLFSLKDTFVLDRRAANGSIGCSDASTTRMEKFEKDYGEYIQTQYDKTKSIIEENRGLVEYLFKPLYDNEFLCEEDIKSLIQKYNSKKDKGTSNGKQK